MRRSREIFDPTQQVSSLTNEQMQRVDALWAAHKLLDASAGKRVKPFDMSVEQIPAVDVVMVSRFILDGLDPWTVDRAMLERQLAQVEQTPLDTDAALARLKTALGLDDEPGDGLPLFREGGPDHDPLTEMRDAVRDDPITLDTGHEAQVAEEVQASAWNNPKDKLVEMYGPEDDGENRDRTDAAELDALDAKDQERIVELTREENGL